MSEDRFEIRCAIVKISGMTAGVISASSSRYAGTSTAAARRAPVEGRTTAVES